MALDTMYARCCHLRNSSHTSNIKQIPKGSMAPIPVLQLRNPPTMIEIQSFADFANCAGNLCFVGRGELFS